MFGIGPMELVVIAVVAIVFVGPQRLPSMMRQFGKFFVQARRYSNDFRDTFQSVVNEAERELRDEELVKMKKELAEAATLPPIEAVKVEEEWHPHPPTEGFVSIDQVAAEEGWGGEKKAESKEGQDNASPVAKPVDLDEKIRQAQQAKASEAPKPKA